MSEPKLRVIFDPTVNLGHILTAATFLIVGTSGYVALDGRVGVLERSYREEQTLRQAGDAQIEARVTRMVTEQRVYMEQVQGRTSEDVREIKGLVREGFRELDAKLDRKIDKPGR